jgi:hypothetical protein
MTEERRHYGITDAEIDRIAEALKNTHPCRFSGKISEERLEKVITFIEDFQDKKSEAYKVVRVVVITAAVSSFLGFLGWAIVRKIQAIAGSVIR